MVALMTRITLPKWHLIDSLAASRGVSAHARAKWRTRGIPYRWRLVLLQDSAGGLHVTDFEHRSNCVVLSKSAAEQASP